MPGSIKPNTLLLIALVIGVVLVIYIDPFGFREKMKNTRERFNGLTTLNKKLFEQTIPMETPNVVDPNKYVPDIPQNSAQQLNTIIFPELTAQPTATVVTPNASVVTPNASVVTPNASVVTPNASVVTPNASVVTPNASVETTPVEETKPVETTSSQFELPAMIIPVAEQTDQAVLPQITVAEPVTVPTAEPASESTFTLPQTIDTNIQEQPAEIITLPAAMKDLAEPEPTTAPFVLPSIINTNEVPIIPQNENSVLTSLEEQNKPVDVQTVVLNNQEQNAADLVQQQVAEPVPVEGAEKEKPTETLPPVITPVTTSSVVENTGIINNVLMNDSVAGGEVGGVVNGFTNTRIYGAFPLRR
jgi:hypothetical protein